VGGSEEGDCGCTRQEESRASALNYGHTVTGAKERIVRVALIYLGLAVKDLIGIAGN
jgi:3-dehydroquinate synthetase